MPTCAHAQLALHSRLLGRMLFGCISSPPSDQVIQLAFVVACLYTGVGLLRLGWVVRFLSHSVITGFTSGAAFIIASSQVGCATLRALPPCDAHARHLQHLCWVAHRRMKEHCQ